jgi:hypothetical protein
LYQITVNFAASSQVIDPLTGLMAPAPPNLLIIRGPIYVEPSALQPLYINNRVPGRDLPLQNNDIYNQNMLQTGPTRQGWGDIGTIIG